MSKFDLAFDTLIKNEGTTFTDESFDGQKTKFGITQKFLNSHNYKINVKDLDLKKAKSIYEEEFWIKLKCYKITCYKIAVSLFDFGVNQGHYTAVKLLQKALNKLGEGYKLKEDGLIGKNTLKALNTALDINKLSRLYSYEKLKEYNADNLRRYERYINNYKNGMITINELEEYINQWQNIHNGWCNRTLKMI